MMRLLLGAVALSLAACGTPPADETVEAVERLLPIKQHGAWGYINKHGEVVIAPRFDMAWTFSEGLALVSLDDHYGYIDPSGAMVIEPRFEDAWYFSEGLAPVQLDDQWGFIDRTGALAVDPQFDLDLDLIEEDHEEPREFGLIKRGDRYGFMNEQGQVVIDARYDAGLVLRRRHGPRPDRRQVGLHRQARRHGHRPAVRPRLGLLRRPRSRPTRR